MRIPKPKIDSNFTTNYLSQIYTRIARAGRYELGCYTFLQKYVILDHCKTKDKVLLESQVMMDALKFWNEL